VSIPGIVLHEAAETQLNSFLETPTHALLLAGPTGSGKTHIAAYLSMRLLDGRELETNAYYRVITPEKGSIAIEQIRELIGFFRLKVPGTAKIKRIAVVQDADAMGGEAQNALLKLLEEPPTDSVLVLTSSQPQKLLPTIRSRVQLVQLATSSTEVLTQHFAALKYDGSAITSALLRAGTNVAEATRLLAEGPDASNSTIDLVKQVLGGTSYDRLLLVDGLAKQKDATAAFVSTLTTIAMASLESAARKGGTSVHRWQSVLEAAHTAQDALDHSGNAKLVLTELMLAM
jgi:DNA polymerase-3 subunit delta'